MAKTFGRWEEVERIARSMMVEFNRKKKAFELNNSGYKNTGFVSPTRLCKYKTSDDIFKRKKRTPEGKAHGVYILLDASASMDYCFHHCVAQCVLVSLFCKYTKIPFKVVTFTSSGSTENMPDYAIDVSRVNSFEIMSHNMDISHLKDAYNWASTSGKHNRVDMGAKNEYVKMLNRVENTMSGTPLFTSIINSYCDAYSMISEHKIQNMNFYTITDGEDNCGFGCNAIIHPWNSRRFTLPEKYLKTAAGFKFINKVFSSDRIKHHGMYIAGYNYTRCSQEFGVNVPEDFNHHADFYHTHESKSGFASVIFGKTKMKDPTSYAKIIVNEICSDFAV